MVDPILATGNCVHPKCTFRVQFTDGSWQHVGTFGYMTDHEAQLDYSLLPDSDGPIVMPDGTTLDESGTGAYHIPRDARHDEYAMRVIQSNLTQLSQRLRRPIRIWIDEHGMMTGTTVRWESSMEYEEATNQPPPPPETTNHYLDYRCWYDDCSLPVTWSKTEGWKHELKNGAIADHYPKPFRSNDDVPSPFIHKGLFGGEYTTAMEGNAMVCREVVKDPTLKVVLPEGLDLQKLANILRQQMATEPMMVVPETEDIAVSGEVRMTNATTGAQKGAKDAKYNLIPVGALEELAKLYGFGSKKYAPRNWERGYEFSLSYDALQRHANQWWGGENIDSETQLSHLASVAWHAFTLFTLLQTHPELDDRPSKQENERLVDVYDDNMAEIMNELSSESDS